MARPLRAAARLMCPHTDEIVAVELDLAGSELDADITVFRCEYFGEMVPYCDERCLRWSPDVSAWKRENTR